MARWFIWINRKIKKSAREGFRFLLEDYESDYSQLLTKINKPTLEIRRLRLLATDIFKTINNLNAPYMKEVFELNTRRADTGSEKLIVQSQISMKYGSYTLRSLGPKIWHQLPNDIKNSENLSTFKIFYQIMVRTKMQLWIL